MNFKQINSLIELNELNLNAYLDHINYHKFNLWDININDKKKYVLNTIEGSITSGAIFACTENNEIISLLIFKELVWDTHFFGFKCGKIEFLSCNNNFDLSIKRDSLKILMDFFHNYLIENNYIHCMADISSWEVLISKELQKNNFQYLLSWSDCFRDSKNTRMLQEEYSISPIKESELSYIKNLSGDYFKGGRFYLDENFPNKKVDKLYKDLITNSYNDGSTVIMTLRTKDEPIGAFLCKKIEYSFSNPFNVRSLRLLVFDKNRSIPGLATSFMSDVANELYRNYNCDLVASGMEIHNLPSVKIHTKAGYKLNYTHNAYHWWNKMNNQISRD